MQSHNNELSVSGNLNVILQNVNARDIRITIKETLPAEVKTKKDELKTTIENLVEKCEKEIDIISSTVNLPPEKIDIEVVKLLTTIEAGKCILFIGPNISVDDNNISLHEKFYKELAGDEVNEVTYNEKEGLFEESKESIFEIFINRYYAEEFSELNIKGKKILGKLATLPFKLSVSFCPDDTLHDIYTEYDIPHSYVYFNGNTIPDIKPSKEKPVILNVLGSAKSNEGNFVHTYKDIYSYIKTIKLPPEIKKEINNAHFFLFIGFDFKKWNNRLLLFVLGMNEIIKNKILIESNSSDEIESFLNEQFNMKMVKDNYDEFTDNLADYAKSRNITINLLELKYKHQLLKLKVIADLITDAKTMVEITEIEEKLNPISKRIINEN